MPFLEKEESINEPMTSMKKQENIPYYAQPSKKSCTECMTPYEALSQNNERTREQKDQLKKIREKITSLLTLFSTLENSHASVKEIKRVVELHIDLLDSDCKILGNIS